MNDSVSVKLYHGYGHAGSLIMYGHVFKFRANAEQKYSNNIWTNIRYLFQLFVLKPYPFVRIRLSFYSQIIENKSENDGFFKVEWTANEAVGPGFHAVTVEAIDENGETLASCVGKVYIPYLSQFAVISDVDDTVMVSHSATIGRRLRELFIKNPHTRKTFPGVREHFGMLARAFAEPGIPNPFFYVSSSEWNLYDYIKETFRYNQLPEGIFLLNTIKQWKHLFRTGKTGHEGKLLRIMRIISAFPEQKFVFFGDNSQSDPVIYAEIAKKYAVNFVAVYIRNVVPSKAEETKVILERIKKAGIPVCFFRDSFEAISHSIDIGLIVKENDKMSIIS